MKRLLTILALLHWTSPAAAETYYVATTGTDAWPGCTQGSPCQTIDYAADQVSAGDSVRVAAGAYDETVTPGVNGTSGNAITFVADGAVTVTGWDFSSNSYIRMIGFTVDSNQTRPGAVIISGTNSYLEFWNNTFTDALYQGIRTAVGTIIDNSLVIGNTAHTLGIGNYSGTGFGSVGDNNVIAYNTVTDVDPDAFFWEGSYGYLLNNYAYGMREDGGGHPDFLQNGNPGSVWTYNTCEGNFQVGAGTPNDHVSNIENPSGTMTQNIWRRNVAHGLGSGTHGIHNLGGGFTYFRYYHNTIVDAQESNPGAEAGFFAYGSGINDTYIHNNIDYESWANDVTSGIMVYDVEGTLTLDYNLAYDPDGSVSFTSPWTTQAHPQTNVNPNVTSYAADDFTLSAGSGDGVAARGTGGPLTTTSGSGTGTTFNVASNGGGFFRGDNTDIGQYDGALIKGDTITVGTDVLEIASISGDAVTVTSSFTWADGDPVYFGNDTTPDLGAYPYRASGYTLSATYATAGGTTTIAPNDASLVRWVVCYSDGVPYAVANASPYTCSVPTGAFEARVYPLFASKTLWTVATAGTVPNPPANLRIR